MAKRGQKKRMERVKRGQREDKSRAKTKLAKEKENQSAGKRTTGRIESFQGKEGQTHLLFLK